MHLLQKFVKILNNICIVEIKSSTTLKCVNQRGENVFNIMFFCYCYDMFLHKLRLTSYSSVLLMVYCREVPHLQCWVYYSIVLYFKPCNNNIIIGNFNQCWWIHCLDILNGQTHNFSFMHFSEAMCFTHVNLVYHWYCFMLNMWLGCSS